MDFNFLYKDYSQGEGSDPVPKIGEEITRRAEDGQIKMVTMYKRNHSARTHRRIIKCQVPMYKKYYIKMYNYSDWFK